MNKAEIDKKIRTNLEIFAVKKKITAQWTKLKLVKVSGNLEYFDAKKLITAPKRSWNW